MICPSSGCIYCISSEITLESKQKVMWWGRTDAVQCELCPLMSSMWDRELTAPYPTQKTSMDQNGCFYIHTTLMSCKLFLINLKSWWVSLWAACCKNANTMKTAAEYLQYELNFIYIAVLQRRLTNTHKWTGSRTRATELWIICSWFIIFFGRPGKRVLQKSNLLVTKMCFNLSVLPER